VRKRELVRPFRADDAASIDVRRAGGVDRVEYAEGAEDRERVVGEELAARPRASSRPDRLR
jgi:hypothetical protein